LDLPSSQRSFLAHKLLGPKVLEAANIDGQTMIASKGFAVAYFKDERVAINDFIITYDLLNGSGPSRGYRVYDRTSKRNSTPPMVV
jgi:hypothetical protein